MTEKERLEQVRNWVKDDTLWRKHWGEDVHWARWEDEYRGHFRGKGLCPTNLIFEFMSTVIPQIYFKNPYVQISVAESVGSTIKAQVAEAVVNRLLYLLGIKEQTRMAAQDCWLCGTGILMYGYDSLYGQLKDLDQTPGLGQLSRDKTHRVEYVKTILADHPWALRVHPMDILFAWGAHGQTELRRMTVRYLRLLDDVKSDPRYTAKVTKDLAGTKALLPGPDGQMLESSEDWIYTYRTYDYSDHKVYDFTSEEGAVFLSEEQDPLMATLNGAPCSVLTWNRNSRAIWGVPDAKIIDEQQREANMVSTLASRERRTGLMRGAYDRDKMEQEDIDRLESELPPVWIGVDGDPEGAFKVFPTTGSPVQAAELERITHVARSLLGISQTRAGSYTAPTKRTTAREVSSTDFYGDVRDSQKRDAISDLLSDCSKKLLRLVFRYWNKPRVVHAPHIDARYEWIVFDGPSLAGSYDYRIDPEEMRPPTHQEQTQESMMLGTQLVTAAMQGVPGIDPTKVVSEIVKHFYGWDAQKFMDLPQEPTHPGAVAYLTPQGFLVPLDIPGLPGPGTGSQVPQTTGAPQ